MNQGIHGIDIMLLLMGEVESVNAFTANRIHDIQAEDTVCASVRFQSGALGTVLATTAAVPGYPQRLTVTGEKGSVTLKENEIEAWDIPELPQPVLNGLSAGGFGGAESIAIDGHVAQIADFTDAIAESREPVVTLEDGRRAVELIKAIYRSADEHTEIKL